MSEEQGASRSPAKVFVCTKRSLHIEAAHLRRVITSGDARANASASVIVSPQGTSGAPLALRPTPQAETAPDDYLTRVVKYIPAEIVAAFLTIDGILKSITTFTPLISWLVFAFLLILTPLYTWRVTTEREYPPAYAQIIISSIAFAVWVFAIGGPFNLMEWYQPAYGSILLILFTLIPPLFSK